MKATIRKDLEYINIFSEQSGECEPLCVENKGKTFQTNQPDILDQYGCELNLIVVHNGKIFYANSIDFDFVK